MKFKKKKKIFKFWLFSIEKFEHYDILAGQHDCLFEFTIAGQSIHKMYVHV